MSQANVIERMPNGLRAATLSFCCVAVMYVDRAIIANAIMPICNELHIDTFNQGWIFASFAWGYVLGMPMAGVLGAKYSPRNVIGCAIVFWALSLMLTASSGSAHQVMASRFLLGISEAPIFPCLARLVAESFPHTHQTRATAFFDAGSYAGPMLGGPLFVLFAVHAGWRTGMFVLSLGTLAFCGVWFFLAPRVGRIPSPRVSHLDRLALVQLLRDRRFQLVSMGFFSYNFAKSLLFTWLPVLVVSEWRQSETFAASLVSVCFGAGLLGLGFSSLILDRKRMTAKSGVVARARAAGIGLSLGALLVALPMSRSLELNCFVVAVASAGVISASAAIWTIPAGLVSSPHQVPIAGAAQNLISNLANIVAPLAIGATRVGHWRTGASFILVGIVSAAGAMAFFSAKGGADNLT